MNSVPKQRPDDGNAFLPDPEGGPSRAADDLAEVLGEDYVESATNGEHVNEEVRDEVLPEEVGGPFVGSPADVEFADDIDAANPKGADVEPFPRAVRVPNGD